MSNKKYLLIIFALILSANIFAQTGGVKGFIYDKETGEVAMFANVVIKGTTMGTSTDINGYFTISNVPIGSHTLEASFLG